MGILQFTNHFNATLVTAIGASDTVLSLDLTNATAPRRDQTQAEERQALVEALVQGERSGVSKRTIPDILAAMKTAHDATDA